MAGEIDVIVGTPICRCTSFVLDKFLANQQEIQQVYPACTLVLATDEPDFVAELEEQVSHYHLKGEVIIYETVKPDYARSRIWSIVCGREALRQHVLSQEADLFLSLDGDMVFDTSVISILKSKVGECEVAFGGYYMPRSDIIGFGAGCVMISREILSKFSFTCYEFSNGEEIDDGEMLDLSLFKCRAKVNKGIFLPIKHYSNSQEYYSIEPQAVSWFRRMANSMTVRYVLVRVSIMAKSNIPRKLKALLCKVPKI